MSPVAYPSMHTVSMPAPHHAPMTSLPQSPRSRSPSPSHNTHHHGSLKRPASAITSSSDPSEADQPLNLSNKKLACGKAEAVWWNLTPRAPHTPTGVGGGPEKNYNVQLISWCPQNSLCFFGFFFFFRGAENSDGGPPRTPEDPGVFGVCVFFFSSCDPERNNLTIFWTGPQSIWCCEDGGEEKRRAINRWNKVLLWLFVHTNTLPPVVRLIDWLIVRNVPCSLSSSSFSLLVVSLLTFFFMDFFFPLLLTRLRWFGCSTWHFSILFVNERDKRDSVCEGGGGKEI